MDECNEVPEKEQEPKCKGDGCNEKCCTEEHDEEVKSEEVKEEGNMNGGCQPTYQCEGPPRNINETIDPKDRKMEQEVAI